MKTTASEIKNTLGGATTNQVKEQIRELKDISV